MKGISLFLTSLSALSSVSLSSSPPEQIHIALAGVSGLRVAWFTSNDDSINPGCIYGTNKNQLSSTSKGS